MRSRNKVELIGHLGAKPSVTVIGNDVKKVELTIATSEKYKKKATGEVVEKTEWHRCVAFGKPAEIIEQYMDKGMKVLIEGKLTYSNYEKEGQKHYVTNIVVHDFMFLSSKGEGSGQQASEPEMPVQDMDDSDLPF